MEKIHSSFFEFLSEKIVIIAKSNKLHQKTQYIICKQYLFGNFLKQ